MRWERLGLRFVPDGSQTWARSHASTPWGSWRPNGLLRVHFSSRDEHNRSHIGWVDLDPTDEFGIVDVARQPTLSPGEVGLFDDSGVSMGCLVEFGGRQLLYYVGWNLAVTVPWRNTIGLAISDGDGSPFVRHGRAPVLDRHQLDPYSLSYPSVLAGDDELAMWYGTNDEWGADVDSMVHSINRATSTDGVDWRRDEERAIRPELPLEYAISRPVVRRIDQDGGGLEMFYCHRATPQASTYRIGWATSDDGATWLRRDDEIGLDVAHVGWDSEMLCYPFVFDHDDATYLLYNGNGYGRSGFGLARLAER